MINTSKEYKRVIQGSRNYEVRIIAELSDGTQLTVENDRIVNGSLKIEDAVSNSGSFDIGAAIINQFRVSLYNGDGYFDKYEFDGAMLYPYIGVRLGETTEFLKKGVYIVDEAATGNSVISIQALDMMTKFERSYTESTLVYPASLNEIVRDACRVCGVGLGTTRFDRDDYIIKNRPDDEKITFREVISHVAEISGCFARFNMDGNLEIKWYDFSVFEEMPAATGGVFDQESEMAYVSGDSLDGGLFTAYGEGDDAEGGLFNNMQRYHHLYRIQNKSISTDDVVITGVRVTAEKSETGSDAEEETYLYGQEGYVLAIENNPLVQTGETETVAEYLGQKMVGIRFRPLEVTALADPSVEAGDSAFVSDMKGNSYQTVLTSVSFTMGGLEKYVCDAKSPQKNSATRYSSATKAVVEARRSAKAELDSYDKSVQYMNRLAANTLGFYYTEVKNGDGSMVAFRHDKPMLEESQIIYKSGVEGFFISTDGGETYVSGFDKDGNAVMNILSAVGINADWINAGSISADRIQGGVLTLGGESGFGEMVIVDESGRLVSYINPVGLNIGQRGALYFLDENYVTKSRYNSYGATYYERGREIGQITSSYKTENPEAKGLSFLLGMEGELMSWCAKEDELAEDYATLMEYYRSGSIRDEGIHFYTPIYTYNHFNLGSIDAVHSESYTNGNAGFVIESGSFVLANPNNNTIIETNPDTVKVYTTGSKTVHCWNNLDLHYNSVLNQSDARLKKNIRDTKVNALELIDQIELKEFEWIENGEHEEIGMIAQQLQEIAPELVVEDPGDGHLSIRETKVIPYLLKAVQELYRMQSGIQNREMKVFSAGWQDTYTEEEKALFTRQINRGTCMAEPVKHKKERTYIEEEKKDGNTD